MKTDDIVRLAEFFSEHTALKISTISTYAANDGKWLTGLKEKTSGCTLRKADNVVRWFDANWPLDLEWPTSIQRPSLLENRRAI
ncbi:hypothetical protein [Celeribacter sp.]|uniref:hypothetical protein n=1 Tax=Celeribacter sp. TaxID=1890673 RepID=UPI003A90C7AC